MCSQAIVIKMSENDLTEFRLSSLENRNKEDRASLEKLNVSIAVLSEDVKKLNSVAKLIFGGIITAFLASIWKLVTKGGL